MVRFDWQLILVFVCIAVAVWRLAVRLRRVVAGESGCGDCFSACNNEENAEQQDVVTEEQIEILYDSKQC